MFLTPYSVHELGILEPRIHVSASSGALSVGATRSAYSALFHSPVFEKEVKTVPSIAVSGVASALTVESYLPAHTSTMDCGVPAGTLLSHIGVVQLQLRANHGQTGRVGGDAQHALQFKQCN